MNEGEQTIYNVVPMVTETTGMKRIYISPPVMVEQIAPHNGVKYTATISAGERIKTGNVTIRVAVADGNGQQYGLAGVLTSHRAINKFSESIQTEHRDVENLTA